MTNRAKQRIKVEKAVVADLEAILELQQLAYKNEAELLDDFSIQPLTQTLDDLKKEYKKGTILKAVDETGRIIGSVRACTKKDTGHIGKLIVHPEFQGRGIGSCLLEFIEQRDPQPRYELFTSNLSSGNLRLYERRGYVKFREEDVNGRYKIVYLEKNSKKS